MIRRMQFDLRQAIGGGDDARSKIRILVVAAAQAAAGSARPQLLADDGIRVNCVAPGPIWTPLIPSTMPQEKVESFGKNAPLGRAGQPAELAPAYVLLASADGSYMTGAMVPLTGGRPMLLRLRLVRRLYDCWPFGKRLEVNHEANGGTLDRFDPVEVP